MNNVRVQATVKFAVLHLDYPLRQALTPSRSVHRNSLIYLYSRRKAIKKTATNETLTISSMLNRPGHHDEQERTAKLPADIQRRNRLPDHPGSLNDAEKYEPMENDQNFKKFLQYFFTVEEDRKGRTTAAAAVFHGPAFCTFLMRSVRCALVLMYKLPDRYHYFHCASRTGTTGVEQNGCRTSEIWSL